MDQRRYTRTPKGQAEISEGRKTLKGKLRTVLFLVDPGKDAADIERQLQTIAAPVDALDQLVANGYIVPVTEFNAPMAASEESIEDRIARFRVAKAFMNDTIVDALGIRAFGFTLKLERCATATDLATLLPDYAQALLKKLDRDMARALVERTRELLADALR